jgi:Uma2 family endonuclease
VVRRQGIDDCVAKLNSRIAQNLQNTGHKVFSGALVKPMVEVMHDSVGAGPSNQMRNAQTRSSYPADWYIEDDESMPQSTKHVGREFRLMSTLLAWNARTKLGLLVGCELAFRWDSKERGVGIDPDVYVAEMPPLPPNGDLWSMRTWKEGHHSPMLAIEIVSHSRPKKDYTSAPERHDLLGTFELWVYDPHLYGNSPGQSPVYLQVFQRETNSALVQKYAGSGPFRSDALDAWVMVVEDELVISNDREGHDRWLTLEEEAQSCADAEAKRADDEAKRADDEARRADDEAKRADDEAKRAESALARIAELEAMLAKRDN